MNLLLRGPFCVRCVTVLIFDPVARDRPMAMLLVVGFGMYCCMCVARWVADTFDYSAGSTSGSIWAASGVTGVDADSTTLAKAVRAVTIFGSTWL
jgi:hypothetical protein